MNEIVLNKKQSKEMAKACYGDIKQYCDSDENFERFILVCCVN